VASVILTFDTRNIDDYRRFLAVKQLPRYRFIGNSVEFPDEYADRIGLPAAKAADVQYDPMPGLFDYQQAIARMAIRKQKFCVFADCGLGKTLIFLEYARHVARTLPAGKCILIVSPLMVVGQTIEEAERFYGESLAIRQIRASELNGWLRSGSDQIGITNYEALKSDIDPGRIEGLILDESSILKSFGGAWAQRILDIGRGIKWKLACTGTPAPNDRIEYANHAVLMDAFPTVNAFLSRFFINRGQTQNRWELKRHARRAFYRALSDWCIFLSNPATYGWRDNTASVPPIQIHIHDVPLTDQQRRLIMAELGTLCIANIGGIGKRSIVSQIAKGFFNGEPIATNKPEYILKLVQSWPEESTIIWCKYNYEQDLIERVFPGAASMRGSTSYPERKRMIDDFKAGRTKVLISKPEVLGLGLNLQIATRHVFSGLQDSYEQFYQAVKRSNRIGSIRPLNVHIPTTEAERPMIESVLAKAKRVQEDTELQEKEFKNAAATAENFTS